jgi:hypothetical protein
LELIGLVERFVERFVSRRRSPADDQLDRFGNLVSFGH